MTNFPSPAPSSVEIGLDLKLVCLWNLKAPGTNLPPYQAYLHIIISAIISEQVMTYYITLNWDQSGNVYFALCSFSSHMDKILDKASGYLRKKKSRASNAQAQHTTQGIPENSNPSPPPPSPPAVIPKNILTFRTITRFLSLIQQEQVFEVSLNKPHAGRMKELTLATAFATIAVIDKEVYAVVTKPSSQALEVLCTSHYPKDPPAKQEPSGIRAYFDFGFFVTRNPREGDPKPAEPLVSDISNAKFPGHDLDDDKALDSWVAECW